MKTHDSFGFRMTLLAIGSGAAALLLAVFLSGCSDEAGSSSTSPAGAMESGSTTSTVPNTTGSSSATSPQSGETAGVNSSPTASGRSSVQTPATPAEAKAALLEGTRLFDTGDWQGAVDRLTVAVSGRPDDARSRYLLGLALWKSGRAADAERELAASASLNDGSVKTWINLARVRLDRDDATTALEAAEKACTLSPDSPDALHQKGRALGRLGRSDEAIDTLTRAAELAPDNGYIENSLGNTLLQVNRFTDAVPHLEQARDRLPGVAFVRNNLAVAYERTGRLDEAIAEYQAAVAAGDSGGKARGSLARLGVPVGPDTNTTTGVATAQPATKDPENVTTGVSLPPPASPAKNDPDTDGTLGGSF